MLSLLQQRLEPELVDDDEWVTFLVPGLGTNQSDPTAADTVVDAIATGFQPPEVSVSQGLVQLSSVESSPVHCSECSVRRITDVKPCTSLVYADV